MDTALPHCAPWDLFDGSSGGCVMNNKVFVVSLFFLFFLFFAEAFVEGCPILIDGEEKKRVPPPC